MHREEQGNPTENTELPSVRKLKRRPESSVEKEEPEFNLRIEGIANDVISEDEERMGIIQEVVEKSRNGSRTESVLEDLGKPEHSMKFSEKSSRSIQNRRVPFSA